jgi:hypothetical protein
LIHWISLARCDLWFKKKICKQIRNDVPVPQIPFDTLNFFGKMWFVIQKENQQTNLKWLSSAHACHIGPFLHYDCKYTRSHARTRAHTHTHTHTHTHARAHTHTHTHKRDIIFNMALTLQILKFLLGFLDPPFMNQNSNFLEIKIGRVAHNMIIHNILWIHSLFQIFKYDCTVLNLYSSIFKFLFCY